MGQQRRKYTDDYKAAAVERLYEPGATQGSVAKELGITGTQLKTWRLEIEAFGSVEAKRRQQGDAAELIRLRKENKRLAEEVEILHIGETIFRHWSEELPAEAPLVRAHWRRSSAFFATRAVKPPLSAIALQ